MPEQRRPRRIPGEVNLPTLEAHFSLILRQWLRQRGLTLEEVTREDLREILILSEPKENTP